MSDKARQSDYNRKFNIMLKIMVAPDGGAWTGTKMLHATGGKMQTSYYSSFRDGHISIPKADKLEVISSAMGFAPHLWFKSVQWWEALYERWEKGEHIESVLRGEEDSSEGEHVAALVRDLLETIPSDLTGETMTSAEVAERSRGAMSEEDVEALLEGERDPSWPEILALCDVFGVDPSYFSRRRLPWRPSPNLVKAAEDNESYVIFQNSLQLSHHDRGMLKILSEHLRREQKKRPPEGPD